MDPATSRMFSVSRQKIRAYSRYGARVAKRTEQLWMRVTPAEKQRIRELAAERGLTVTQLVLSPWAEPTPQHRTAIKHT